MTSASYIVSSPREAHQVVTELYQSQIKPHVKGGARGLITWQTVNDYRRHQLRKLFHGPVLRDVSEQVWVRDEITGCRVRYQPLAWKRLFAEMFIEPTFEEYTVKATGEVKVRERRRSTEELSDDEFAEFVLQATAFAAVDLNVQFTEQPHEDPHA